MDETQGVDWTPAAVIIAELGIDMAVFQSVSQLASWAGFCARGTYLRDKSYRLKARRGHKRASVAIVHKILVAVYHMLSQHVSYNDLGDLYLDKPNRHHSARNLVRRLERLGY